MGNLEMVEGIDEPLNMDFEPVPVGKYLAKVVESDVVPTKSGTGTILKLTHEIIDSDHAGKKVFSNLNVANPNPKAEQIGRGMISSLSKAVGMVGIPNDSLKFHDKPHYIKVGIEKSEGYEPRNVVKAFYPYTNGVSSGQQTATPAPTTGGDTTNNDDIPW